MKTIKIARKKKRKTLNLIIFCISVIIALSMYYKTNLLYYTLFLWQKINLIGKKLKLFNKIFVVIKSCWPMKLLHLYYDSRCCDTNLAFKMEQTIFFLQTIRNTDVLIKFTYHKNWVMLHIFEPTKKKISIS